MSTGRTFLSLWHGQLPWPEPHRTMCEIALEVCQARGVTLDDLRGRSKAKAVAWPRQEFMALAYAQAGQSLPAIGRWLDGRDHTTVMQGIRRHERRAAFA